MSDEEAESHVRIDAPASEHGDDAPEHSGRTAGRQPCSGDRRVLIDASDPGGSAHHADPLRDTSPSVLRCHFTVWGLERDQSHIETVRRSIDAILTRCAPHGAVEWYRLQRRDELREQWDRGRLLLPAAEALCFDARVPITLLSERCNMPPVIAAVLGATPLAIFALVLCLLYYGIVLFSTDNISARKIPVLLQDILGVATVVLALAVASARWSFDLAWKLVLPVADVYFVVSQFLLVVLASTFDVVAGVTATRWICVPVLAILLVTWDADLRTPTRVKLGVLAGLALVHAGFMVRHLLGYAGVPDDAAVHLTSFVMMRHSIVLRFSTASITVFLATYTTRCWKQQGSLAAFFIVRMPCASIVKELVLEAVEAEARRLRDEPSASFAARRFRPGAPRPYSASTSALNPDAVEAPARRSEHLPLLHDAAFGEGFSAGLLLEPSMAADFIEQMKTDLEDLHRTRDEDHRHEPKSPEDAPPPTTAGPAAADGAGTLGVNDAPHQPADVSVAATLYTSVTPRGPLAAAQSSVMPAHALQVSSAPPSRPTTVRGSGAVALEVDDRAVVFWRGIFTVAVVDPTSFKHFVSSCCRVDQLVAVDEEREGTLQTMFKGDLQPHQVRRAARVCKDWEPAFDDADALPRPPRGLGGVASPPSWWSSRETPMSDYLSAHTVVLRPTLPEFNIRLNQIHSTRSNTVSSGSSLQPVAPGTSSRVPTGTSTIMSSAPPHTHRAIDDGERTATCPTTGVVRTVPSQRPSKNIPLVRIPVLYELAGSPRYAVFAAAVGVLFVGVALFYSIAYPSPTNPVEVRRAQNGTCPVLPAFNRTFHTSTVAKACGYMDAFARLLVGAAFLVFFVGFSRHLMWANVRTLDFWFVFAQLLISTVAAGIVDAREWPYLLQYVFLPCHAVFAIAMSSTVAGIDALFVFPRFAKAGLSGLFVLSNLSIAVMLQSDFNHCKAFTQWYLVVPGLGVRYHPSAALQTTMLVVSYLLLKMMHRWLWARLDMVFLTFAVHPTRATWPVALSNGATPSREPTSTNRENAASTATSRTSGQREACQ